LEGFRPQNKVKWPFGGNIQQYYLRIQKLWNLQLDDLEVVVHFCGLFGKLFGSYSTNSPLKIHPSEHLIFHLKFDETLIFFAR